MALNFSDKTEEQLLSEDILSLDEKNLRSIQKALGGKIKDANKNNKTLLIEKNKKVSHLIKTKFPKVKKGPTQQPQKKKAKFNMVCANCNKNYETSTERMAFCRGCRIKRQKDLIEIVTLDPDNEKGFKNEIFDMSRSFEVEEFLSSQNISIRLDLHGVADLTSSDTKLGDHKNIAIVSFVGHLTNIRIKGREELIERVLKGQINFGVLVFLRGKDRDGNANNFQKLGSKAWFNKHLSFDNKALFVDDSTDHCESVKSLGMDELEVNHFKGTSQELVNLITEFESSLESV